jgi:hypothetical protein
MGEGIKVGKIVARLGLCIVTRNVETQHGKTESTVAQLVSTNAGNQQRQQIEKAEGNGCGTKSGLARLNHPAATGQRSSISS